MHSAKDFFAVAAFIALLQGLSFLAATASVSRATNGRLKFSFQRPNREEDREYLKQPAQRQSAERLLGAMGCTLFACYIYVYVCCFLRGFGDDYYPLGALPAWLTQVGTAISPGCYR